MDCLRPTTVYGYDRGAWGISTPRRIPQSELSQPPVSLSTAALVPSPLFSKSKRRRLSAPTVFVAAGDRGECEAYRHDGPEHGSSSPRSSRASTGRVPISPTMSTTSTASTTSPASSAPTSPTLRTRSLCSTSSADSCASTTSSYTVYSNYPEYPVIPAVPGTLDRGPHRALRRKKSPKDETLRNIRARESDACLQRIYEIQTRAYLDGSILANRGPGNRLGIVWESP